MSLFAGVYPILCTAFDDDGRIDVDGQLRLVDYLLESGAHGLGLFGTVERIGQIAIVAGIWIVQLILSPIWLSHFQYGPFEWLWRSLTYGSPQPFRRAVPLPAPATA